MNTIFCMRKPVAVRCFWLTAVALLLPGMLFSQTSENDKSTKDSVSESTRHAQTDGQHAHTNSLIKETSPYLLMHAHNPVNWYGWGDEALERARKENKPIFLSIGYSSCHWCHVMERESFLDQEIAKYLNEHFVCIKVDREERPDVDAIYMESLQVFQRLSGSGGGGGWPLSMFLTPQAQPFFGGTYFPARDGDRGVGIGFYSIIRQVNETWKTKPEKIKKDAGVITTFTQKSLAGQAPAANAELQKSWVTMCVNGLKDGFDPQYGGFRYSRQNPRIPKFPEPSNLMFLADQVRRDKSRTDILNMLNTTCSRMMMGGIQDHLGGGFHRYSTDRYWSIPHFEKMLYDNGQLATVYAQVYELTGNESYRRVIDEMMAFVLREMRDPGGAFYASLDAESEGEEGRFYRWELAEIRQLLDDKEYQLFARVYGLDQPPNFENEYYVPQLAMNWEKTAATLKLTQAELENRLKPIRKKLFDARAKRPRPLTDKKILASWNGLMIRGLADAGRILDNRQYIEAAEQASEFILGKMVDNDGRLVRTYTNGQAKLNAYIDDYACLIDGLLALHRATGQERWLNEARRIQAKQDELFWDENEGGYFYTSSDHETLLARAKKPTDGAMPSGNSVAAGNLAYLAEVTQDESYQKRAKQTALAASPIIEQFPIAAPRMLITIELLLK